MKKTVFCSALMPTSLMENPQDRCENCREYYAANEVDAELENAKNYMSERDRLKAELEHQKQLYADHIGDEHENCGVAINQRLIAAAENVIKKTECRAVLSPADLAWLKREVKRALEATNG